MSEVSPIRLTDNARAVATKYDLTGGTVVVVGNFDGVHKGHQALFARAIEVALGRGLLPVALTFDPHPRTVLGQGEPDLLTTTERRVELISGLGLTRVFVRHFDRTFAAWSPARFVEELLVRDLAAKVVVAGNNFHFGAKRAGNAALLHTLGQSLGFEAMTLEATDEWGVLSSSRAREAVVAGDMAEAQRILGRPHSVEGTVEAGQRRGRTIGFPTANLGRVTELVPRDGVYAVTVDMPGGSTARHPVGGVMNIGVRPTVDSSSRRTLEAHLFDVDEDLYGKTLRVHFVGRLRDERKFDGLEALRAQIALDSAQAREAIADAAR